MFSFIFIFWILTVAENSTKLYIMKTVNLEDRLNHDRQNHTMAAFAKTLYILDLADMVANKCESKITSTQKWHNNGKKLFSSSK